jgi:HEPN domain-containing protein
VEQTNIFTVYLLGKWLDSIFLSARMPIKQNAQAWEQAVWLLDFLIVPGPQYGPRYRSAFSLTISGGAAVTLRQQINKGLDLFRANPDVVMDEQWVATFNHAFWAFEQALALELGRAPIYFVSQKGIYATSALINTADSALVDEVHNTVSYAAKKDLSQAGRCLAFEVPTAAAFHALRAVEKVLREFYEAKIGEPAGTAGMKRCIDELTKAGADKKTIAALDQLRDLHRNPIDHPEEFVDFAEALEIFNAATVAISKMARQIAALKAAPKDP